MNEQALRAAVQSNPNDHAAWHALGLLAFERGDLPLAVQCLEAATAIDGRIGLYVRNLGEMHRRAGALDKAVAAGRKAVKLLPGDVDALYNLALALSDAGRQEEAIKTYRRVLQINERHNLAWNNLGSVLEQREDKAAALAAYERAVAIAPGHAEAQNNTGAIYSEQGRLDDAREAFGKAIAARPDFVEAHYNLSSLKKYTQDDPHLAMLEEISGRASALPAAMRIRHAFALGKALDDIGQFDRAFAAYDTGNRLQHAMQPMDEAAADEMLRAIISTFDEEFFAERQTWQGAADARRTPVFIVGMPRSGTTLLEQILCSHPDVYGAGELTDLNTAVMQATGKKNAKPFPAGVTLLGEEDLRALGEAYLASAWRHAPERRFITDKMPANFFYLGLIHLALPHAKIIHAMRDPMDSCFSCFSRLFNDTMAFAYDQGTLGRYYVRYMTLMRHWRRVLPAGTILDLPYEEMVADTEGQARRVLEFAGLPWDDRCLRFHENQRLVKTASVAQVRRPIYTSSLARWKHFARHLRPLFEIVREFRPQDGAEALFTQPAPEAPEQLHDLGIARYREERLDEALALYDRALALRPDFPAALNSRGFVLQDMDRMDEAARDFARAVELAPDMAMARLNLGMAQLKLGDWAAGWENYEARWTGSAEAGAGKFKRLPCPLPVWRGEAGTKNKRLLLVTEQGFGDTFQMLRFLPVLAERFARIGFACSPPTQRLIEWSFPEILMTLTRMPPVDAAGQDWDFQCALMSLPGALQIRPDTVPAEVPYLKVPPKVAQHWRERLESAAPGRLRVGIAWAGRREHQSDKRRSVPFERLIPLLAGDARVTWVCLQKWAPQETPPAIPAGVDWLDWTAELSDFGDTAALLGELDLVISVDSALVHLAGALGRPVWMLDRFDNEWRWLRQRTDSPWYPSLRIFRQRAFGDWDSALQPLREALSALPMPRPLEAPRPRRAPALSAGTPDAAPAGQGGQMLTPEQAMQRAAQLQTAGRLPEAEQLLRQILQGQPEHPHALHLLGVVAYQAGHAARGMALIDKAIGLAPNVPLFFSNLGEMCRQQGQIERALALAERATEQDASAAAAWSNLGLACFDAGQHARAESCHARALALAPGLVQSLNNMGSLLRVRKDKPAAIEWYRKALAVDSSYLEALSNLGAVLVEDSRHDEAIEPLERALTLRPDYPEALCNLGLARFRQERNEEATSLLQRSLQLRPEYPEALVGLAMVLHQEGRVEEAIGLLRKAAAVAPDNVNAWVWLGSSLVETDQPEAAEAAYMEALRLDEENVDGLAGLGNLRVEQGRLDEAESWLKRALSIDPDNLGAHFQMVQMRRVQPDNVHVDWLLNHLPSEEGHNKRISLHYALGKAYDDLKCWDQAFPHFLEGARLKRSKLDYDPLLDQERVERIMRCIDKAFIERHWGGGHVSEVPILVLGMPRSGTTLTEQILASHPDVFGAGELRDLLSVCQSSSNDVPFPENLAGVDGEALSGWGREYVERLQRRAPDARRITDKMPGNYLVLGLIPLMLPKARIVHVRRNPVDTCVSCFTRLFNRHQEATYDLAELGRHYAMYARLMAHWRAVLPAGSFLEVQYEEVVADLPGQARRLLDFAGLPWNDACLDFHKTERSVRTASVTQVRQPIYKSSVARWKHYEHYLGPLLEALGEYADV
ncbi:sulfotransferase [Thauera sp.]|uniref:sulfotransferase n=1 Tax=Thauera sp. TaxID=1905334 RepID=UPI0039E35991